MAEAAAAATALLVGGGIAAYVFGSFFLMGKHVSARQIGRSIRELARELWVAGWTQPLIPLFYLLGRRMDAFFVQRGEEGLAKARVPIVFVHGYMQNRVGFLGLARALGREGLGPMYGFNYPWFTSIASNAKRLDRFVERVCTETGAAAVDLVCHSMGGLVAMEMMRDEARREKLKVRRCVTIATPHAGVMWRGPLLGIGAASLRRGSKLLDAHAGHKLAVPCLSVYSTHDNIVHPKESSSLALRGGRDVEVDDVAHLAILFSPRVAEHVASFLAEPDAVEPIGTHSRDER
jgi:pimeloyl-ACP methyl ester carboxylesterase